MSIHKCWTDNVHCMMSLIINVATNVIATQTTPLMTTTMSHCAQELK